MQKSQVISHYDTEPDIVNVQRSSEWVVSPSIARAIVQRGESIDLPDVADFESITGMGVRARVGGTTYLVGKPELFLNGISGPIGRLRQEGKTAVLVGTESEVIGAIASVGIAMGAAGTDAALETADVALMADDLSKLPYLFQLAKTSRGVIRQNVSTSILVKLILVIGVFPGMVSLAVAVLVGDMGTSLGVTGNALRLSRIHPHRFRGELAS